MRRILFLLFLALSVTSCIPRKKLTYLQQAENNSGEIYHLNRSKYQVQPNDILSVTIRTFDETTARMFNLNYNPGNSNTGLNAGDVVFYLNGFSVDFEGNIDMPVVGKVNVQGKNIEEIKILIEEKLSAYFKEDAAFVTIQLAGVRYSIIGDVNRPGKYVIFQNQVNIFEALAQAGDITMLGDRKRVQIVRQLPDGVRIYDLDLTDARVINDPNYFIQPNDIINVKPLSQKTLGIGTTGFQTFAAVVGVLASTVTLIFTLDRLGGK